MIAVSLFGLAAVSVAQDTVQDTETAGLCTGFVAQDPQTKQALKIQVGSATREDVARLLGKPWRTSNDADCDAEQTAGDVGIEMKPARLLLLLTGFTLLGAIAAAAELPALAGNPLWKLPVMELSSTRERPIFSASRRPPTMPTYVAPVAIRPPVKPPELERPAVSLVGTVIGTDVHIGVFLETATKNVVRLRVGEDHQRWVLRLITAREVTLVKDSGQAMVLNLPPPGEASDGLPRVATGTIPVVSNENYVDEQPRPVRARQKR